MPGFSAGLMKSFLEFQLEKTMPLLQMLQVLKGYNLVILPETVPIDSEITNLIENSLLARKGWKRPMK